MEIKKFDIIATRKDLMLQIYVDKSYEPYLSELNGDLEVEIKPLKKARSMTANSYLWVLCDKIAKVLQGTKEEAKALGIEVMPPDRIKELKDKWNID